MAKIRTIPLFKNTTSGARGTAGTITSDPIDLRDISQVGTFSLSYALTATNGASGTVGTTNFAYTVSPTIDGTYVSPTGGTFGTAGPVTVGQAFLSVSPVLAPFMKIQAISGTSNPSLVTAELHVR